MNKLVIVESGDRLGKTSLIKGLCEYYDYKNVTIRHCDKPPKNIPHNQILDYQMSVFEQECNLISYLTYSMDKEFMYHDNIIIYDRFYLGEFVYGSMFRNYIPDLIKKRILTLEQEYIKDIKKYSDVYLITFTADPEFFFSKEDGNSFSDKLEDKTKELELFNEAHEFSTIKNKLLIKVDNNISAFRPKEEILKEVIRFIK